MYVITSLLISLGLGILVVVVHHLNLLQHLHRLFTHSSWMRIHTNELRCLTIRHCSSISF